MPPSGTERNNNAEKRLVSSLRAIGTRIDPAVAAVKLQSSRQATSAVLSMEMRPLPEMAGFSVSSREWEGPLLLGALDNAIRSKSPSKRMTRGATRLPVRRRPSRVRWPHRIGRAASSDPQPSRFRPRIPTGCEDVSPVRLRPARLVRQRESERQFLHLFPQIEYD